MATTEVQVLFFLNFKINARGNFPCTISYLDEDQ